MQQNNIIKLTGKIINQPFENHKIYNEIFYIFNIKIKRLSQTYDILPVTVSQRIINNNLTKLEPNKFINITGQIRSYNNFDLNNNKTRLILTVFAQNINFDAYDFNNNNNFNQAFLNGYICKKPIYRKTPLGREITDILLAVNRFYNKSDYIPCIAWGQNAKLTSKLNISDNIKLTGRLQSRDYQKKMPDGEILNKTTYELSISKLIT